MRKLMKKIICCALLLGVVASGGIAALNGASINADAATVGYEESSANAITVY